MLADRSVIPVSTHEDNTAIVRLLKPSVLVDARMRKRAEPETQRHLAPLTIGLGPNFIAGATVHLVIETSWEAPGDVIEDGAARPLSGEPRAIAGHQRDRYVYAPTSGMFRTPYGIGDAVNQGTTIAWIGGAAIDAPLTGVLRGITRDGVPVDTGTKIVEVDPRGEAAMLTGLGERPMLISEGVRKAIQMTRNGKGA